MAIWKHVQAILLLPVMVLIVIPSGLLCLSRSTGVLFISSLASHAFSVVLGLVIVLIGLQLVSGTIALFMRQGEGTLAPWNPPQKLVISGPYCHVRNPMISGVGFILLGESLIFPVPLLRGWTLLFLIANAIYIPVFEEPKLLKRFGQDYLSYKENVPRWLPRLAPWHPPLGMRKT